MRTFQGCLGGASLFFRAIAIAPTYFAQEISEEANTFANFSKALDFACVQYT